MKRERFLGAVSEAKRRESLLLTPMGTGTSAPSHTTGAKAYDETGVETLNGTLRGTHSFTATVMPPQTNKRELRQRQHSAAGAFVVAVEFVFGLEARQQPLLDRSERR